MSEISLERTNTHWTRLAAIETLQRLLLSEFRCLKELAELVV